MRLCRWQVSDEALERGFTLILRLPALLMIDFWDQALMRKRWNGVVFDADLVPDKFFVPITSAVLVFGFAMMLAPLNVLVAIYMHLLSGILLEICDSISGDYVEREINLMRQTPDESPLTFLPRLLVTALCYQSVSMVVAWFLDLKNSVLKWLPMLYVFPMACLFYRPLGDISEFMRTSHELSRSCVILGFTSGYILDGIVSICQNFKDLMIYCNHSIEVHGFFRCFCEFCALFVDDFQFFLLWLSLFLTNLCRELFSDRVDLSDGEGWLFLLVLGFSDCCYSPITLASTCFAVMYFSERIIKLVWTYLMTCCSSQPPPSGAVRSGLAEGVVMFMVALQTDLMEMDFKERWAAMFVVLHIVASSLFHTILEITHPVLIALSASSRNVWSHFKALLLCAVIFFVPAYMSLAVVRVVNLDLWTLVVISSSVLTSIQVVGHVIHYSINLYDSSREEPLESLEDLVFYLKSFIAFLELLSAVLIIGAGIRESWEGNLSLMNFMVLSMHFYYNVLQRIQKGWRQLLMREMAVKRIQELSDATQEQLSLHNDVCSICYTDMLTFAKVTPCDHFFHGRCLKKWLFLQDNCPLCQSNIIKDATVKDEHQENVVQEDLLEEDEELVE